MHCQWLFIKAAVVRQVLAHNNIIKIISQVYVNAFYIQTLLFSIPIMQNNKAQWVLQNHKTTDKKCKYQVFKNSTLKFVQRHSVRVHIQSYNVNFKQFCGEATV